MPHKISQAQNDTYCIIPLTRGRPLQRSEAQTQKVYWWLPGPGEKEVGVLFTGDRDSGFQDSRAVGVEGGDGGTTTGVHSLPLGCTLTEVKMTCFMLCLYCNENSGQEERPQTTRHSAPARPTHSPDSDQPCTWGPALRYIL